MTILQELLNIGLVDVGSDDSRFEKMQTAAGRLAQEFTTTPAKLISATLIILDADIDEDDPFLVAVERLVIEEWTTLRNTHTNRPRELLRSVILAAVHEAMQSSPELSAVVWNTSAGRLRANQFRLGKSEKLVLDIIDSAMDVAEKEAVNQCDFPPRSGRLRAKKSADKDSAILKSTAAVSATELQDKIAQAVGPTFNGNAVPGSNPHAPAQHQVWVNEFVPKMAAAVAHAVSLGTARLGAALATFADDLRKEQAAQAREIYRSAESSRLRVDVLWWSEAMYSPLWRRGYGDLSPASAALVASFDLAELVPPLAPASIDYVLAGMLLRCAGPSPATNRKTTVKDMLEELTRCEWRQDLVSLEPLQRDLSSQRVPLLSLAVKSASGCALDDETIRRTAGIDPGLSLSIPEFGVWIFQELQAHRLVQEKE